jgi:hypothetical protein
MKSTFLSRTCALASANLILLLLPTVLRAAPIGPSPYLSRADSPFTGTSFDYFHLEDFEDGTLNTPGVSAIGGSVLMSGSLIDSVDGDDGAIDGSGSGGRSYYSANSNSLTFVFDVRALGALPTHVGLVWTDVGFTNAGAGFGDVLFEAFDSHNTPIASVGPAELGDCVFAGQTAEDRFFGIIDAGGIGSIRLSMPVSGDWEMDHLQYGREAIARFAISEPSTLTLLAGAAALALIPVRRRRAAHK